MAGKRGLPKDYCRARETEHEHTSKQAVYIVSRTWRALYFTAIAGATPISVLYHLEYIYVSSLAIPRWCAATHAGTAKRRRAPGPTGSRMLPRHPSSNSLHPRRDDPRQHCVVLSSAYGVVCEPLVRFLNLRKTLCLFSTMLRPHILYSFRLRAVRGSSQGSSRLANEGVSLYIMLQ